MKMAVKPAYHLSAWCSDQGRCVSDDGGNQGKLEWSNAMKAQFVFFSGKGGVGKTSMACTQAVRYADEGKRTLIVTTDPASNLADVFKQEIGHQVTAVAGVANLWAMEIDPDRATQEYIDRALAPVRAAFPCDRWGGPSRGRAFVLRGVESGNKAWGHVPGIV